MAGRKTATLALELAREVEARLLRAGIAAHRLPPIEATFAACWPLAKRLRRAQKQAVVYRDYAQRLETRAAQVADATASGVDQVTAHWQAVLGQPHRSLVKFDPAEWSVDLCPAPARGQQTPKREAA